MNVMVMYGCFGDYCVCVNLHCLSYLMLTYTVYCLLHSSVSITMLLYETLCLFVVVWCRSIIVVVIP